MTNNPPKHILTRHSVGDCEMLENPNGQWVRTAALLNVIKWLEDDDRSEEIQRKFDRLKMDLA